RERLEELDTSTMSGRAARGYVMLADGETGAAWTLVEPYAGFSWPAPSLLMLLADLELRRGRPEEAQRYANAALKVDGNSLFARLTEAEAVAAVDPEVG